MSKLEEQFREDRALRNSALAMFKADIEHVKTGLSGKGLAERTVGRVIAGAKDALETTGEKAGENKSLIAAMITAVLLWFAREPILEALDRELNDDADDDAETDVELEVNSDDTPAEIVLTPPEFETPEDPTPGDENE